MAYTSYEKLHANANGGIQSILNILRSNDFQFSNRFWAVVIPPKKLDEKAFYTKTMKLEFQAYVKSINLSFFNIKSESIYLGAIQNEYPTASEGKEPLSISFYNDRFCTPELIMEGWKEMILDKKKRTMGYWDDVVGKVYIYVLADINNVAEDKSSIGSDILGVAKDIGKYIVRRTGAYQFTDDKPLQIPEDKIMQSVAFCRVYTGVFPVGTSSMAFDKADDATVSILTNSFAWNNYNDYFSLNSGASWKFGLAEAIQDGLYDRDGNAMFS